VPISTNYKPKWNVFMNFIIRFYQQFQFFMLALLSLSWKHGNYLMFPAVNYSNSLVGGKLFFLMHRQPWWVSTSLLRFQDHTQ
jgi:hypothetical protein